MKKILMTAAIVSAALLSVSAQASVITFNEFSNDSNVYSGDFTSGGLNFKNDKQSSDEFLFWAKTSTQNEDPGFATLSDSTPDTTTTVSKAGGGIFDLTGLDIGSLVNDHTGGDILFSFKTSTGTTTQTVSLSGLPGEQFFTFNKAGIISFSFVPETTQFHAIQIDNVNVNLSSATPEPATWAMMIIGFGMTGGILRSLRRKSTLTYA